MIKNDPSPDFARIFARRPDLSPPGYEEAVQAAVEARIERKKIEEEIRNQKSQR
jgi:hypothetical protein